MGSGPMLALAADMACHGPLLSVVHESSVSSCASIRIEGRWGQGGWSRGEGGHTCSAALDMMGK